MTYYRRPARPDPLRYKRNLFVSVARVAVLCCQLENGVMVHVGEMVGSRFVSRSRSLVEVQACGRDGWDLSLLTEITKAAVDSTQRQNGVHMLDIETYKAFGSFAPVYTSVKQDIFDMYQQNIQQAHRMISVLDAMAQCCNSLGLTYVGVRGLMERSHRSEGSVKRALQLFKAMDWIRIVQVDVPGLGETVTRTILSPWVLWISKDSIEQALELWSSAEILAENARNNHCNGHPESESESESSESIQRKHPAKHPPPPPVDTSNEPETGEHTIQPEGQDRLTGDPEASENNYTNATPAHSAKRSNQTEGRNQREAQGITPPGSAAPPPVTRNLRQYWEPLSRSEDEQVAQDVLTVAELRGGGTRPSQARDLVVRFGRDRVASGVSYVKQILEHERDSDLPVKYRTRSAMARLTWWLERGAVAPNDAPAKVSKYDHLFER